MSVIEVPDSHTEFVDDLTEEYRKDHYDIVEELETFSNGNGTGGRLDLLLEDNYSGIYKIVDVTRTGSLNPDELESTINESEQNIANAREYYSSKLPEDPEIKGEIVLGVEGHLQAIKEIWDSSVGTFTWEDAKEAVSEPGRLGYLRDQDYLLLNYEVSRTENEEHYEFNPEIQDELLDIFLEFEVYP